MDTAQLNSPVPGKGLPIWAWWVIGLAVIVAVTAAVVFLIRSAKPQLPPGLVQKRESVAKILEDINKVKDVDIRPLVELESKKDYKGAVGLMDKALEANAAYEHLANALMTVSDELAKLAVQVRPDDIGTKAVEAFGSLANLAQAEKSFYRNRRALYETTKSYYADLDAKKTPPIPDNLRSLVEAINSDLNKAKELNDQFAKAVKAFDDAASMK